MLVKEIKEIARQKGIDPKKMRKAEMIKAIQTREGNTPCFQSAGKEDCGETECSWRSDCMK